MQAIIEYENSEIETIVGLQGFGRDVAKRILDEYDVVRMWLIQDDEDPDGAVCEEPYWSLDTYWVMREDGNVAKIMLNNWHDGDDIWSAIDDDYPEAYDLMDECPVSAETSQLNMWDASFRPGQGEELAAWLKEWDAVVEERDSYDLRTIRTIGTVTGCPSREVAVRKGEDLADGWINRQACDLAELVVIVCVGGEEARRFKGGQWEDVE